MEKKEKVVITGRPIKIKGFLARHKIVKRVIDAFINTEHRKKGKGVIFQYPVEDLPRGQLFISRPGHKKNFDFKVKVTKQMQIGEGSHKEIALDLRKKKLENQQKFKDLLLAIGKIYHCSENDVNHLLANYSNLKRPFQVGAKIDVILKVIKWLFIMEDIIYWDNEGRAFLYNFLIYVANETNEKRLKKALLEVKTPDRLKSYMKKSNLKWIPYKQ